MLERTYNQEMGDVGYIIMLAHAVSAGNLGLNELSEHYYGAAEEIRTKMLHAYYFDPDRLFHNGTESWYEKSVLGQAQKFHEYPDFIREGTRAEEIIPALSSDCPGFILN